MTTTTIDNDIARSTTHDADEDERNKDIFIYINGEIVHRDEARVSVYDSGFMLGDGMWEGMRLYNGKWAFFEEHMDRLFDSCKAVSLDIGLDRPGIADALQKTADANNMFSDVHCRLMITRGVKVKPFQHPSLSRAVVLLSLLLWSTLSRSIVYIQAVYAWRVCLRSEGCHIRKMPSSTRIPS